MAFHPQRFEVDDYFLAQPGFRQDRKTPCFDHRLDVVLGETGHLGELLFGADRKGECCLHLCHDGNLLSIFSANTPLFDVINSKIKPRNSPFSALLQSDDGAGCAICQGRQPHILHFLPMVIFLWKDLKLARSTLLGSQRG